MSLLPTEKTKPRQNFQEYITLIYGPPKIGKSSLASQFDNPLFLPTEPGLNSLETFSVDIADWEKFLAVCAELSQKKNNFKTLVIDTVDNLYKFCTEYVYKKAGIQHASDLGYGKGWQMVSDEFFRVVSKLSHLGYGLVFISHAEIVEVKTRIGNINKWVPTMSRQAKEVILPLCDFIFFATTELSQEGQRRVIKTKPSENWEGGDRTGKFPPEIEMSYKAIKEAFEKSIKTEVTK